eukprot:TRINITY_DN1890_c0_g1_i3.p1 TRINITY_DN1890_c0_g1~~TRINITY_DN1890_c0_g1_i3.p1  ORF type:complete len:573 (-),score=139.83 TRINITY_DN1890_c0_g1_i3:101-1819(-)
MQASGRSLAQFLGLLSETGGSVKRSHSSDGDDDDDDDQSPPELVLKDDRIQGIGGGGARSVGLSQIQQLILWVASEGVNPSWILVKHKSSIPNVVLLLVDELSTHYTQQHPIIASTIPDHFHHLQVRYHGSSFDRFAILRGILSCPSSILPNRGRDTSPAVPPALKKRRLSESDEPPPPPVTGSSSSSRKEEHQAGNIKLIESVHIEAFMNSVKQADSAFCLTPNQLVDNKYPVEQEEIVEGKTVTYVETGKKRQSSKQVVAVDCEMCITRSGYELTRLTLVDFDESVLVDMLVLPSNPILDHNTKFSGITAEMMLTVTHTLVDAQAAFLRYVCADTVVVGHSLENDFRAVQVRHFKVMDTALLYGHPHGPPKKPALRNLTRFYLRQVIQEASHDSAEDAIAALRMAKLKVVKGLSFGHPELDSGGPSNGAKLMDVLAEGGNKIAVFDDLNSVKRYGPNNPASVHGCKSDVDKIARLLKSCRKHTKFNLVRLTALANQSKSEDDRVSQLSANLITMFGGLPSNSLVIILTGSSTHARFAEYVDLLSTFLIFCALFQTSRAENQECNWSCVME